TVRPTPRRWADERRPTRRPRARGRHRGLPRVRAHLPGEALMGAGGWITLLVIVALIAITTPLLGGYMAKVYGDDVDHVPGDRIFGPVERLIYRICRIDPEREQRWSTYALSLLAFSLVSVLVLYGMQRLQQWLPAN